MIIPPSFGTQGHWFESRWRWNSTHDCTCFHCTFIAHDKILFQSIGIDNFPYFSTKIYVVGTH